MILIGTSGYSFPDWVGPFYPPGTERGKMLDHYVRHFGAVEVNSTYYRIPPPSTFHAMERKTPAHFEFVVKAHHDMTHERSLDDDLYRSFARAIEPLRMEGKLSGILAQFPYAFRRTPQNEAFLGEMKERLPDAPVFVEFRHDSWIRDDLFQSLVERGLGYVSVDEPDLHGLVPPIARVTGEIGYVRFHGRNKKNWWGGEKKGNGDRASYVEGGRKLAEKRHSDFGPLFTAVAPAGAHFVAGQISAALDPSAPTAPHPTPTAPHPTPAPRTSSDRYDYLYSEAELKEWVDKIRELTTKSKKTFVFFNNCHVGQAATGAKLMRRLLEGEGLL